MHAHTGTPLIAGEVVVDASLHVLESVQGCKHVDEFGQREQVRLRNEVLLLLRVSQGADFLAEFARGAVNEAHELLGLCHLRTQYLHGLLVNLHSVGLFVLLDL